MGSAISIGTTGLTASEKQMDVIGNNLANSNTVGFKAGNTYFASMFNQSLSSSGSMAVGQGVKVAAVATQFSQGSFETTGNATDLAIDGEGFFVVKDANGAAYYTRAGAFHVSKEGLLVDGNNYKVQGFSADTEAEKPQDISFDKAMSKAKATTEISLGANLDDNTPCGERFNVSQNVFDSRGQIHNLSIAFLKTEGNGIWGFDAKLDGTNLSDAKEQQASGLAFDGNGALLGMFKSIVEGVPVAGSATGGAIVSTTVTKPGQLYKTATGIILTKGPVGGWTVTDPGYKNAIAWQETIDGKEVLKVDLDGKGGSDIDFDLGASGASSGNTTEVATVTFASPLAIGDTITIAGRIFTATAAATAAQVATAFAGGAAEGGTMSGTLTGYTASAGTEAGSTLFTSTTVGTNVADLTATGTAEAPISVYVQGGATEVATMTFADILVGETIIIAGRTFTAGASGATAAQVAAAFVGGTAEGGTMSGTLTGYTASAGTEAGSTLFTSTAVGTNVDDLTATGTAEAPISVYVQGGATEVATMTFADLLVGETIIIADQTFTAATGGATAAQVATAFAGGVEGTVAGGTLSGTLTGYTASAGTAAGSTLFTSTTVGTNVADLTATVTGTAAPSYAYVQGGAATTTNKWLAGDTVTFGVTKTDADPADVTLCFGALSSNPNGEVSTIGLTSGTGATTKNKINWDLVGNTAEAVSGYASPSVLKSLSDNGYTFGILKSINVENNGVINCFFTNGQTSKLGQLILASFRDPSGLTKIGNYFGATSSSAEAITNKAGSSGLGEIKNHSLEISNTDVAKEFINMITAQRAYQASSRIITTADQMLTELMNIKR